MQATIDVDDAPVRFKQSASASSSSSPFSVLPSELSRLVADAASGSGPASSLQRLGGIHGLARVLHVQLARGVSATSTADWRARQQWFGANYIAPTPRASILAMMFATAFQDPTNFVLVVVAVVSIALGVSVGTDPSKDWMEGACVLAAVAVIALVSALTDAQKAKQFEALNAVNDNEVVRVVRDGEPVDVRKWDLVVGDVVRIGAGDILPADGIAIDAIELHVDESTMTGESEYVVKTAASSDAHALAPAHVLLAGTRAVGGFGKMLVLCVGEHSQYGQMMALVRGAGRTNGPSGDDSEAATRDQHRLAAVEAADCSSMQDTGDLSHAHFVAIETPRHSDEQSSSCQSLAVAPAKTRDTAPTDRTPLGAKLDALNLLLGKIGIALALLVFAAMSLRFSIETFVIDATPWRAAFLSAYLSYFLLAVTVLVVAIPEGLPLAVAIALAHAVHQMLRDNNLVRHLNACETAGNATTICSDKTGTLTTNAMRVARVWLVGSDASDALPAVLRGADSTRAASERASVVRTAFCEGVALNSTAELLERRAGDAAGSSSTTTSALSSSSSGSKTECALLEFIRDSCGADYRALRRDVRVRHVLPFSSERKRMSAVVEPAPQQSHCRVYTKGAAEAVLALCTRIQHADGQTEPLEPGSQLRAAAVAATDAIASQGYRTICLAYRDVEASAMPGDVAHWSDAEIECDLTCLAIVGIEDPVRPEVPGAVAACKRAGVVVRMVTGDNVLTACSIARQCGILDSTSDGDCAAVMDGPSFRRRVLNARGELVQSAFDEIWPALRVLARSSPTDKYHLVQGLKHTRLEVAVGESRGGEQLVAVTGDGTNDAAALKAAHVGFAMGVCGTGVAKEAADIIVMDDNFLSIVHAIKWGRNVYDSIGKFLQFQLTVITVAVALASLGGVVLQQSPITAVQILWVNLFMDAFASLALATEPPTAALLERKPYARSAPLVSRKMAKHIGGQAVCQLVVLVLLTFYGDVWFDIPSGRTQQLHGAASTEAQRVASQHMTIVFNAFAWLQLFNELNCRKLHDERSVVLDPSLWRNSRFLAAWLAQAMLQVMIVELGGDWFHCVPLTPLQWLASVAIGSLALPLGYLLRVSRLDSTSWPRM